MKVILQQDLATLGKVGDVVRVRDGYGRNFLIPRGIAAVADEANIGRLDHQKRMAAARSARLLKEATDLGTRLSATAVSIRRQAGEDGKLFGSVSNRDVAEALAAEGLSVDRKDITLADPIRNIGVFSVPVKLHRDVTATVKVYVIQA